MLSSILNRLPWWIGFAFESAMAKSVWRIMLFNTLAGRRSVSVSVIFGNSGNSAAFMPMIVKQLTPEVIVAVLRSSLSTVTSSAGDLRTISENSLAVRMIAPGAEMIAGSSVCMPISRS